MNNSMKTAIFFIQFILPLISFSQITGNDADHPCLTPLQYEMIDKRVADNIKLLKLADNKSKEPLTTLLSWPLRPMAGFTDCSYYIVTAYVDENTAAGAIGDFNCGTNTYDTHKGTDICTWPFPFYKLDHSQVEVIAAAAGTIIDKADGNFDRNCSSNSMTANYVIVQHDDGSYALYWHMKSGSITTKAIGQTVLTGEYLGVVGSSGSSSGPHLHFEVWTGSTSATYKDPFSGTCNTLNANSWWQTQKPYTEPAVIKASVHTTDAIIPACDTTETPNESTTYQLPFQGQGLPAGMAKFYIFLRDAVAGTVVNLSILNPGGTTFNSWTFNCNNNYNGSYWTWTKALPSLAGTYTFQATYNGISCSQNFNVLAPTSTNDLTNSAKLQVYPNPSNGIMHIACDDLLNGNYTLSIKNTLGQTLFQENTVISNNNIQKDIPIATLPAGIYILSLEANGNTYITKINKQN